MRGNFAACADDMKRLSLMAAFLCVEVLIPLSSSSSAASLASAGGWITSPLDTKHRVSAGRSMKLMPAVVVAPVWPVIEGETMAAGGLGAAAGRACAVPAPGAGDPAGRAGAGGAAA